MFLQVIPLRMTWREEFPFHYGSFALNELTTKVHEGDTKVHKELNFNLSYHE
jgi:hypothetical protein